MIILFLILLLICLYKINFAFSKKNMPATGGFYSDYLSVHKTNSIKGIFIVIVFSHI